MAYQNVKGTYDILPDRMAAYTYIFDIFQQFLQLYGYALMETPVLEDAKVFLRDNATSDMVTKEMYTFTSKGGDLLSMRPEGTAGIIRSFVQNKLYVNELPYKVGYIEQAFRYEKPQKGRYRQFYQLGVEALGKKDPLIDAECIALGYFFVQYLGIQDLKVCLNTLGDEDTRLKYQEALKAYFKPHLDEMCNDCQARFAKNPLRILDCKIDHDKPFMNDVPKIGDYLSEEASAYFAKVQDYLKVLDIPFIIDDTLVRGLDYYTDTVFEIKVDQASLGNQNTLFGGGRYDGLIKELGGPDLSGIGFALGLERLYIIAQDAGIFKDAQDAIDAYIINMAEDPSYALKVAAILRKAGYATELNYFKRSIKAQFKSADRLKARFILIVGEDEEKAQSVNVKDPIKGDQNTVALNELLTYLDMRSEEENV